MWTQSDIDALKTAVASGVLTVRYENGSGGGRTVTYQSLDAMRSLLAEMVADVATTAGTRRRYRLAATKKGFDS